MFNKENTTLVIQGNSYLNYTEKFIDQYLKYFKNVIFSTWIDDPIKETGNFKLIRNNPVSPGPGNINLQIKSSFSGCVAATTKYIIKTRSDILIEDPEKWLEFFSQNYIDNRIFVLGLSKIYIFSPRDQIFAGEKNDMINLFNISLHGGDYDSTPSLFSMYPELYLGTSYYARFSDKVKFFMKVPSIYLYANALSRDQALKEWNIIGTKYMYPVSKNLKYQWPKHMPTGEYNYQQTALTYGEFWHEDLTNDC